MVTELGVLGNEHRFFLRVVSAGREMERFCWGNRVGGLLFPIRPRAATGWVSYESCD